MFNRKLKVAKDPGEIGSDEEQQLPEEPKQEVRIEFFKDDKVEIIKGALAGLQGVVISVEKNNKANILPGEAEIPPLLVPFEELGKVFNEGDFVQVTAAGSEYLGESGLVTSLWDD